MPGMEILTAATQPTENAAAADVDLLRTTLAGRTTNPLAAQQALAHINARLAHLHARSKSFASVTLSKHVLLRQSGSDRV